MGVVVSASLLGIPGAIFGAKKVVELVKKEENENSPSETSENSGQQQSTSDSDTTLGQHGNNAGSPTVPENTNVRSSESDSNLGLYLLVGGVIIFVIVIVVVIVCLLKCRNRNKRQNEPVLHKKSDKGRPIKKLIEVDQEDKGSGLSTKDDIVKDKFAITGNALDALFNNEHFDLDAARSMRYIVTKSLISDNNAAEGIKLLTFGGFENFFGYDGFSTALAYLLSNIDFGNAGEGIFRFFLIIILLFVRYGT